MPYILQILGKLEYKPAIYEVEGKRYQAKLSSKALQEHFGGDYRILLLAPESLVQMLAQCEEEAEKLLIDQRSLRKQMMRRVSDAGLVDGSFDLLLMQSVGRYPPDRDRRPYAVAFENTFANVISSTFSQLLSLLERAREKAIVVDVSTGQNIYVASLLEAVRGALVYEKLRGIMQGGESVNVEIAYVPPVLSENQVVRVEFCPYDVKAFFELPIKGKNVSLNNLVQLPRPDEIRRIVLDRMGNLRMHITTGRLAYNAIKYNTPLVLFHDEMSSRLRKFKEIMDFPERFREVITELEERYRRVHRGDGEIKVTRDYRIDKDLYVNLHFHLALLSSIYGFWEDKIYGREPELSYIREAFSKVYERLRLGLNSRFLERDCNEISTSVDNYRGDLTQARLLKEIKVERTGHEAKPDIKPSDEKRNFFAHSGFLSSITKVFKRGDRVYLTYDEEPFEGKVRSWVDDPER